ncbi:hypothetical protein P3S67_028745 [Capsicum chacoense]
MDVIWLAIIPLNGRIWLIWKTSVKIHVLKVSDQFIHCLVENIGSQSSTYLTVICTMEEISKREELWSELLQHTLMPSNPWVLCGDFNNVLHSEDRMGTPATASETQGFQNLIDVLQFTPLRSKGWQFTWCNKEEGSNRVYGKIDWALGNYDWIQIGHVEDEFLNLNTHLFYFN